MNSVDLEFGGRTYSLLFNGYAMFQEKELFGEQKMLELIDQNSADGFDALCKAVCLLAEQGELARRYEGHEPQDILQEDQIRTLAVPMDVPRLKLSVLKAVLKGYGREIDEIEKDLGLAELEQKKTTR